MKLKSIIISVLLLSIAISANALDNVSNYMNDAEVKEHLKNAGITPYCKSEWGSDHQMVKFCIDTQFESMGKMMEFANTHKTSGGTSPEEMITYQCMAEWKTAWGYNYQMVDFCINTQYKAYRSMN
jgi:hypothetical protein